MNEPVTTPGGRLVAMLEMIRFSHTIFALPFALLAAAMAWHYPVPSTWDEARIGFRWWHLLGILLCMVGARSAAMAFNRLVDRRWDAQNPRTAGRHLPAGTLSVVSVVGFTGLSLLVYLLGTALFLPNWLPLALGLPVLGVLLGYSYAKRFTPLAHYWLGLALMLAPVCVWIALRGQVVLQFPADIFPALGLGLGVFFWVGGFDVIYACQDFEYDRKAGLKSIPVWLGVPGALRLAAVSHLFAFVLFLVLPWIAGSQMGLSWLWVVVTLAIGALLLYEHALVKPDDLSRVNVAFFNVNAVISAALLAAGLADLFLI